MATICVYSNNMIRASNMKIMKEQGIISCESRSQAGVHALQPYVQFIWSMLFSHCECPEEGTRNVVSECQRKLTLIDPPTLLPNLKQRLGSPSPYTRSTVVTAIKFTITDQPQGIHSLLKRCIGDFMKTLQDPDVNVQRVVLVTYNSAGHNRPSMIRDLLDTVLPHLYNETKVREAFRDWMSCRRQRREIFYYSWSPESPGDEKRREGWQMFEGRQEKRSGGSGRVKDVVDGLKAYWSTNQGKLNNTDE